jgi:hypothetical protein
VGDIIEIGGLVAAFGLKEGLLGPRVLVVADVCVARGVLAGPGEQLSLIS